MTDDYKQQLDIALAKWRQRTGSTGSIRAALIDMDGTLYDSMRNHTAAWHRLMTGLGVPSNRDDFYLYEGMTGKATINMLFERHLHRKASDEEVAELYHLKTVYFNEMPQVPPMPAAAEMLAKLKQHGVERVLVTGSGQRSLIDRLNRDFPGMFSVEKMITAADVAHGKPDPEPYLKGMLKAGTKPEESIVIENAPIGVKAGAASGAFTIGLTTGPIPAQVLADAGADIVLPSMKALFEASSQLFI